MHSHLINQSMNIIKTIESIVTILCQPQSLLYYLLARLCQTLFQTVLNFARSRQVIEMSLSLISTSFAPFGSTRNRCEDIATLT